MENIDIDKEISENIDIDKISNRLEFGILSRARCQYIHIGCILNVTSVNELDKNIHNMHLFYSLSNS